MATKIEDNMSQTFQNLQQTWIEWYKFVFLLLIPFLATFLGSLMKDLGADLSSLFSSVKWNMFLMGETFHSYTSSCHTVPNISKPNLQKSPNWKKKHVFSSPKTHQHFRCSSNPPKDPKPTNKNRSFWKPGIVDEMFIPTEISYFHGRTSKKICLGGDLNPFDKY